MSPQEDVEWRLEQKAVDKTNTSDESSLEDLYVSTSKRPRRSRIVAMFVGFSLLLVAALGIYFYLDKKDVSFDKSQEASPDFMGVVSQSLLEEHDTPDDCWLLIHGSVYDLTEYAPTHPGGPEWVTDWCGLNATRAYEIEHPVSLLSTVASTRLGVYQAAPDVPEQTGGTSAAPVASPTLAPTGSVCYEQTYNLEEVEQHDVREDCYYILYGKVYDLTDYVDIHPGNARHIFQECGTEATERYDGVRLHDEELLVTEGMHIYEIGVFGEETGQREVDCPLKIEQAPPNDGSCYERTFNLETVSQHDFREDCYYILYGKVYDLTDYVDIHPGNARHIFQECGTEATQRYDGVRLHDEELLVTEGMHIYEIGAFADETGFRRIDCPVSATTTDTPVLPTQLFSIADVQEHGSAFDCWLVLFDAVYDLTDYMDVHPGGALRISQECGTDATTAFSKINKHSPTLLQTEGMWQYMKGRLGN